MRGKDRRARYCHGTGFVSDNVVARAPVASSNQYLNYSTLRGDGTSSLIGPPATPQVPWSTSKYHTTRIVATLLQVVGEEKARILLLPLSIVRQDDLHRDAV
ncbi:uncharacterized protein PV07_12017 [Cladophialophora immunda]|uniref:Uncharacterized protein n=1 Tax=Cladophialophora immunda TaxID=569365 RepID=A0A0D2CJU6_9EURO|nr:uncharacterized protein PV07_12017 [Cladophialophora immunda]KIW23849.1 hypothetical protein PV07_12017 [Cladophialophora immunda]